MVVEEVLVLVVEVEVDVLLLVLVVDGTVEVVAPFAGPSTTARVAGGASHEFDAQ